MDYFSSAPNKSENSYISPTTESFKNSMTAWLSAFVLLSFLIFASNFATISTFWINRHLRRHSVYCLLNLAIADMVHGLCSVFWYLVYMDYLGMDFFSIKLHHRGMNLVAGLVNTSTLVLSLVSLLLVSMDRVVATFFPFTHRTAKSRTYVKIFVVTWSTAFLFASIPSFFAEYDIYGHDIWFRNLDFLVILFLIVIMLSYIAIFIKIRLQNNHHQQHQRSMQSRHKQEKHLAMTLFIVTVLSLMTWLPFIVNHEIELIDALEPGPTQHNIELLTELVQLTNSLINPIVYVFRMKEFREALYKMVFKCSRVRQRRIHPSILSNHDNTCTNPMGTTERTQELRIVNVSIAES